MVVTIHYVNIQQMKINNSTGAILGAAGSLSDPNVKIRDVMNFRTENRIMVSSSVPNSASNPTIEAFLTLEASGGYQFAHMDQNTLITQKIVP